VSGALLQTLIALALVLGAAAYLGVRVWRTVAAARRGRGAAGCATGCGCAPAAPRTDSARSARSARSGREKTTV